MADLGIDEEPLMEELSACMNALMTFQEFKDYLFVSRQIPPEETQCFLDSMEISHPELFRMYRIKLRLASQIRVFNLLLTKQAELSGIKLVPKGLGITTDLDPSIPISIDRAKALAPLRTKDARETANLVRVLKRDERPFSSSETLDLGNVVDHREQEKPLSRSNDEFESFKL